MVVLCCIAAAFVFLILWEITQACCCCLHCGECCYKCSKKVICHKNLNERHKRATAASFGVPPNHDKIGEYGGYDKTHCVARCCGARKLDNKDDWTWYARRGGRVHRMVGMISRRRDEEKSGVRKVEPIREKI